ncbi:hypothetical protein Clacol_002276 [Clathrus columnatus]|uniref:BPL/LPL catalytic domain-containing protein n=1 Tax=Clathrus columnatus TaxID=1419009 RepID=A0AAV5A0E1_9AGAM|nr:hypothetical protein Clacol_002276 [Clathrus columnatus]
MNVLVYEGAGVSPACLINTIFSLKKILSPYYAVQTISADALISQPWSKSCALLVIPGGRDVPYVSSLSQAAHIIKRYVNDGGSFLGICAGAYFASNRVEWEMGTELEVCGGRPLGFFGGTSKGSVYPGFSYQDESGAHAIDVAVRDFHPSIVRGLYFNGGGEFVDSFPSDKVAAVHCRVGQGRAVLWAVHLEFSLLKEPLAMALRKRPTMLATAEIATNENYRLKLLQHTLSLLSLNIPSTDTTSNIHKVPTSPLPQFLTSTIPTLPSDIYWIMRDLSKPTIKPLTLEDANDTLTFHQSDSAVELVRDARKNPTELNAPKAIIFYENGSLPPNDLTPEFQLEKYYSYLTEERSFHPNLSHSQSWGFGELLMYGEAVTSTQTMLDKNPTFIRALPTPLLSLATYQLSGRGRGGNVWVSPTGCLQFSLLLRAPFTTLPASRLVFIQYLFGIAVIDASRRLLGKAGEKVRLKWPNDIYAVLDTFDQFGRPKSRELKKLGGILVTTSFVGNEVDVVIGCGLNVLNKHPTVSISQLSKEELELEKVTACIMTSFETIWTRFLANQCSFSPFLDQYLKYWLHSDQQVVVNTVNPPVTVRIVGITDDFGLLRTVPEDSSRGGFIDLQPDGNSFDMMAGLIRRKA